MALRTTMGDGHDSIRVLHVDDDSNSTELTGTFLERADDRFDVETAVNVSEGLTYLAENDVDCIVSAYEMPGRDGIEFLEAVRNEDSDLPFILYTATGSEAVASDAISAGVTDYLQKESGTGQYTVLVNRIENAVEAYRSQQLLSERTRGLETLIRNFPGMIYRCRNESDWPMETVEGEVESLTGYAARTLEQREVNWGAEVVHPDDREETWEAVQESLARDDTFEVTYRIVTADRTTKWVWERGRGLYAGDGRPEALEGVITDITDRKRRETRLEQTTARLEALFENSPDMINIHDTDGTIIDPNPRLCEQTGYDESELTEMNVWDLDQEVDPEKARMIWDAMEPGDRHRVDGEYQRKDGSTFPVEIHLRRLDLEANNWFVAISRDITERTARERELQRAREEYEALINGMNDTAWVIDTDETILAVNDAAVETMGYSREELRSMTPHEFDVGLEAAEITTRITDMPTDEIQVFETVHETSDGERIPVEISSSLIPYRGDTAVLSIARDITGRKKREKRLERFASIASHDLRNPLNVAQGRLELAREECDSEHLDHVGRAHERMTVLIEDLLTLARDGDGIGELEPVDLEAVAETCWRHVATADATVRIETDRTIRADRSRLAQLFENLFRNAIEHGGDDVSVSVGGRPDGFYVADDGPGVPEAEREDVFRDGYSTATAGTGYGLSIVEQVADAHGWTVHLTDGEHGGARFDIVGPEPTDD
ncbi:PAS domain S-box protein [Haloarchaeobius amylolyticus]|uniref:histidine kinase n=1 Tax=Haloarchaeobius amylolyticus TaxID=1198296 RepID=A0ABD6BB25_9EURY